MKYEIPDLQCTSSPENQSPSFLHNYLQVPQSHTSQSARSNSSVASMQSDLESCMGDVQFPSDLIEGKVIGLYLFLFFYYQFLLSVR
ncbi:unnamed protein product [Cercopithifilaria johnstoni]|uniref:Uncharacterized protein n=1 Tax=Cercopithifilaria johnstoni TaxID=2874296 RepID=A0A8J2Q3C5_9BILA|nr:unnamed protein product [Cercopithifilaria johnstoni]